MSSVQSTIATQMGSNVQPRPAAQDIRDLIRESDAKQLTAPAPVEDREVDPKSVRVAAAEIKQVVEIASSERLQFQINEETRQLFVQVRDRETGEVIRTIPSEDIMKLRERLHKMVGVLLEEQG